MADFSFSDDHELQSLNQQVLDEPEEFEHWEKLVRAAESQEGGLNRNSSPQAITATRTVYDQFLFRFPLFFGYWKKYADLEFSIAGTEAAEMVYERGIASIGTSVDLWANYCGFKSETNHDIDMIRELFERGAESVGLDFLAHPFWDKYIEFEERLDANDRIFDILSRITVIPLHQYSKYFERYRIMAQEQPIHKLAPPEIVEPLRVAIEREGGLKMKNPTEVERELRVRLDVYHMERFQVTQAETTKRWTYESEIKRPYYHVTELDDAQLANWRNYLDFEEAEGDYARIKFLYERCLVTAANYDEFWFRYARWMQGQGPNRQQEVRNIYQRASYFFVPIAQPAIRLHYSNFEESVGNSAVAIDILEAVLLVLPSHLEAIIALVNLHRRQESVDAALQVLEKHLSAHETTMNVKGALVAESARIMAEIQGRTDEARKTYQSQQRSFAGCRPFWVGWFFFEVGRPALGPEQQVEHYQRVKAVYEAIRSQSQLPSASIKEITDYYLAYLKERGPADAMKAVMEADMEVNGPPSVRNKGLTGYAGEVKTTPVVHKSSLANGLAGAQMHESMSMHSGAAYGAY